MEKEKKNIGSSPPVYETETNFLQCKKRDLIPLGHATTAQFRIKNW